MSFDSISKSKIDLLEKFMTFDYFLLAFSVVLFTDDYLIFIHKVTIRDITEAWIAAHSTPQQTLAFFGSMLFFFSTVLPGIRIAGEFIAGIFARTSYKQSEGWYSLRFLEEYASRHNNGVLYREIQTQRDAKKNMSILHARCVAAVLLVIAGYCLGNAEHQGLFQFVYYGIESLPWYQELPLKVITTLPIAFVFLMSLSFNRSDLNYMYLKSFSEWASGESSNHQDPSAAERSF